MEFDSQTTRFDFLWFQMIYMLRNKLFKISALLCGAWITYSSTQTALQSTEETPGLLVLLVTGLIATLLFGAAYYLLFAIIFFLLMCVKTYTMKADDMVFQKYHVTLHAENFEVRSAGSQSSVNWDQVERLDIGRRLLLMWRKGATNCHIIPIRCVPSDALEFIRAHVVAAQKHPVTAVVASK